MKLTHVLDEQADGGRAIGRGHRQASLLFLAAGIMTLVTNHVPNGNYQAINDYVGLMAVVASPLGLLLPWERWPARATLVYFPFCLALLVMNAMYGSTARENLRVLVCRRLRMGWHPPPVPNVARAGCTRRCRLPHSTAHRNRRLR